MDLETGETTSAVAGSEPPQLLRADGDWETIPTEGVLLGVQPGTTYPESQVRLAPGDILLLVTDGITEARQGGAMLGADGLRTIVSAHTHETLRALGDTLLEGARSFAGGALQDDACLLLARRE